MQHRCNHCPGCTGELERLYGVVVRGGAQDILFVAYTTTSKYSIGNLAQFISDQENFDQRLFSRNGACVPKKVVPIPVNRMGDTNPSIHCQNKIYCIHCRKITELAMFTFQSIDARRNINCF